MIALAWTFENIVVVELVCVLVVLLVAGWAGGSTWMEMLGLSDPPEAPAPFDQEENPWSP